MLGFRGAGFPPHAETARVSDPMVCGPRVLCGDGVGVWGDVNGFLTFARASSSEFSLNPWFRPARGGEQPEV